MPISINGLVTGLDTESIVQGLLEIQQQQIDRMNVRKADIQLKQTAFRSVESKMLSLRADTGVLARNSNNPLTRLSVTPSDETAVSATASSSAIAGVYRLTVNTTAQAHQVASQGFADAESEITQGTFDIRLGSGDVKSITIDGNNNSLTGLATAINSSGAGISASIVKDSGGGATPYRLLMMSTRTGADNAISVTNNLAAGSGGAVQPQIDFLTPVQEALDASVTMGSGAGAISVSSSSNQFQNVISGISFNLLNVSQGQEITLTVAKDNTAAVTAVEDFVKSFNDVVQYIDENSKYNAASGDGGVFLGNQSASKIVQKLRSTVLDVVPGANPLANRLSSVGVTFDDKGQLVLNRSKLESALNGEINGVTAEDVKKIFSLSGESSNSGISFIAASKNTKASDTGYGIDLSQAAEQATITGPGSVATSTVITSANNTLELKLDGKTATVTLKDGTYTEQELTDELESTINASEVLAGRTIKVGLNGGALQLTSLTYGTASDISINSGTALADLGLTAGLTDTGSDVVGSFIVSGLSETAVGRGRTLSSDPNNANTADLQVQVTLSPAQIVAGIEGTMKVSRGLASSLDQVLGDLLDVQDGLLASVDDGFDLQLKSFQTSIDRQKATFDRQQENLLKQFQAMESAISQLQSTSNYLGGQLASLPQIAQ